MNKVNKNTLAYYEAPEGKEEKFLFRIEKALVQDTDGKKMILTGVASSANVDHDMERMDVAALEHMANIINEKSVPLRLEHQKGDNAIVGKVVEGKVDDRGNLNIVAELNSDDPRSKEIYTAMKNGTKLGYSVGGRVKSAVRELVEGMGKKIRTFYDVILDEVSLTPRPANFDAYAIAKSMARNENEADQFRFTKVYDRFLFDNPQLDYLAVIEKSIPDNKWIKVEQSNEDKIMSKFFGKESSSSSSSSSSEEMMENKGMVTDAPGMAMKETSSSEMQQPEMGEKTASIAYVDKKFDTVIDMLKGIRKDISTVSSSGDSLDQESPKEEKDQAPLASDVVSDQTSVGTGKFDTSALDQEQPEQTKKSGWSAQKTAESLLAMAKKMLKAEREGQEDTVGNGENDQPRQRGEAAMPVDTTAHDQEQPVTTKSKSFRKVGLDVTTGTVENTGAMDQTNPAETKTDNAMKNRKLAYEMLKTAKELLAKDTMTTTRTETTNGTTSNTNTNLQEFETAKDTLTPTETSKPETTTGVDPNLDEFETAKEDADATLVATHDIPSSSEKTNSYGTEYKVSDKSRKAPIDLLVAHISKRLNDMEGKLEKHGQRLTGLRAQFLDEIYKDEDLQKSIKELMKIPGEKKSVSMGTPYMFTKDGQRYPLVRVGRESMDFNKSENRPTGSFKDFWKSEKSTMYDNK